jgi:hypothetical protein
LLALRCADEADDEAEAREILREASVALGWERFGTPEEWRAVLLDLRAIE